MTCRTKEQMLQILKAQDTKVWDEVTAHCAVCEPCDLRLWAALGRLQAEVHLAKCGLPEPGGAK
jgi:hypothetical protein